MGSGVNGQKVRDREVGHIVSGTISSTLHKMPSVPEQNALTATQDAKVTSKDT